jgi:putative ABC transport system permease protein
MFMLKNHLRIAWRSLLKNRLHSTINISGLAIGMAVALLIGLWIWDEFTFDHYDPEYKRVAQVMKNTTFNGVTGTQKAMPEPLGAELRRQFGSDFSRVVMSSWAWPHIVSAEGKLLTQSGNFMEPDAPRVLGLRMIEGSADGLRDPSSILLSQRLAESLFGKDDPLHQIVRLDNKDNFSVAGVYADLPNNATFHQNESVFIAPWDYYVHHLLSADATTDWGNSNYLCFVELADHADFPAVSAKIKRLLFKNRGEQGNRSKTELFLHPMSKWHLYSEFTEGNVAGGRIQYVWLFGTIGFFVLLLACINFMNLSTARSEKRAKEVGIRKTIGSMRGQLIGQFYAESMLTALIAFGLGLGIAELLLPFFNEIAGKAMDVPWHLPMFWFIGILFTIFTGIVAGSYPALYLSSFRPINVLKGTFKAGRYAAVPRQVLVVLQFSVSVILIIGTIVVFRQIQFSRDRPVGYDRAGLVMAQLSTGDVHQHFNAIRADLLGTGFVSEIAESTDPTTDVSDNTGGLNWEGKDPAMVDIFADIGVNFGYGKTVGWQFVEGRDFSRRLLTDSNAIVLNQAAVKYMRLKDPAGKTVMMWGTNRKVIGVIKDMVMESPFEPVKQTVYWLGENGLGYLNIRIRPGAPAHAAIEAIGKVWKQYSPAAPFNYRFVDQSYATKFADEERVGRLAGVFAALAIVISCLGLFGMASFMAEQRAGEIGVRKVLGASVFQVWRLLSKDFLALVGLALLIALPAGWYIMHGWLQHYAYRTPIAWWIFAAAGIGAIAITVVTVSYQAIKAGLMSPVNSLRAE